MILAEPLQYLLQRLRRGVVDPELFADDVVLDLFNEAYRDSCERSGCLPALVTLPIVAGVSEYAPPADWARTLSIYRNGLKLTPLSLNRALAEEVEGYYQIGSLIGFAPVPAEDASAYLHYTRTPEPFADLASVPEDGFPIEFYYLLLHYVRWRRWIEAGGAQHLAQSRWERDQYDVGVARLRTQMRSVDRSGEARFVHVTETGRPRHRLAPGVDSR